MCFAWLLNLHITWPTAKLKFCFADLSLHYHFLQSIVIGRLDVDKAGVLSQTDLAERLAIYGIFFRDVDFRHLIAGINSKPVDQLLNREQLCQVTTLPLTLRYSTEGNPHFVMTIIIFHFKILFHAIQILFLSFFCKFKY
jgi:hypothetical protein